ncbi:PHB depolymerase family esterase [Myxococcota bacterium]|nr:PHB depolymerase family esterase [Myxococcota bacterium]
MGRVIDDAPPRAIGRVIDDAPSPTSAVIGHVARWHGGCSPVRSMTLRSLACALSLSLVPLACGPEGLDAETSAEGALTAVTGFGSNPGALVMRVHVPASVGPDAALVVALHGCTQNADGYVGAGWNDLAELEGFYVVYPEQPSANSPTQCFNWFEAGDTARGRGEAASIAQMVGWMRSRYSIDPARVYVTGMSAGGGMAASLLAAYPDVFAAGAIMAGLPAGCASTASDAFTCMSPGRDLSQAAWADRVRAAYPGYSGEHPRVSIWHGTADYTVRDANRVQLVKQWTGVHGISATPTRTELVNGATRELYEDAAGDLLVESYSVPGMGHGTAVDPGFAPAGGCGRAGAFLLDQGICSTYLAWQFFEGGSSAARDAGVAADAGSMGDVGTSGDAGSIGDAGPMRDACTMRDAGTIPDAGAADATVADASTDAGVAPDAGAWVCRAFDDTNYGHVVAGRATRCGIGGSYVCAVGSGARFGLWTLMRSTLAETASRYFVPGPCP